MLHDFHFDDVFSGASTSSDTSQFILSIVIILVSHIYEINFWKFSEIWKIK